MNVSSFFAELKASLLQLRYCALLLAAEQQDKVLA